MTMTINHVSRRRLVDRVINEKTLAKYHEQAMRFQQWMSDSEYKCDMRIIEEVDEALATWIEEMYDVDPARGNRTKCVYAQCGCGAGCALSHCLFFTH